MYQDPSHELHQWWWTAICAKMNKELAQKFNQEMLQILAVMVAAKIYESMTNKLSCLRMGKDALKMMAIVAGAKIITEMGKITFYCGQMVSRLGKMEYNATVSGGNQIALMLTHGEKLCWIEKN